MSNVIGGQLTQPRARRRETMAEDVAAELREAIVMGELPPGAPLRLRELASSLGTSISPIREAVRRLEALGLAEHAPYRGARVTHLAASDMKELYEVRAALENVAVRRAAKRFSEGDAAAARMALDQIADGYRHGDVRAIVHGNSAFHSALSIASGSTWLRRLIHPTLENSERYSAAVLGPTLAVEVREIEARGHEQVLAACIAHDPRAAATALAEHLGVFADLFPRAITQGRSAER